MNIPYMDRLFSVREAQCLKSVNNDISIEKPYGFETCQRLPDSIGTGSMHQISLREGVTLLIEDLNPCKNFISTYESEHFPLKFLYTLNGAVRIDSKSAGFEGIHKAGQSSLFFTASAVKGDTERPAGKRLSSVTVLVDPDVFIDIIDADLAQLPRQLSVLLDGQKKPDYYRITSQNTAVSCALHQIMCCPYKGITRRLFLESKALELIAYQLDDFSDDWRSEKKVSNLKAKNIEKIYQARDILVRNMAEPPGVFELAKMVGISHTNLNKGFHEIFRTTVFGYLRGARLEAAKKLLQAGEMNVTEASFAVGYSSLSYFSAAFREYTGINPGEFIKQFSGDTEDNKNLICNF